MLDHLQLVGLNHKTASITLREEFVKSIGDVSKALKTLQDHAQECVILNTCNRLEFYCHQEKSFDLVAKLAPNLFENLHSHLYYRKGLSLVNHLFEVTASLDSLVVGETQIINQVKEAYELACQHKTIGPNFHMLFQGALQGAKEVHSKTSLGQGHVSVASVALDLCEQVWEHLEEQHVLLLGSGTMGALVLESLLSRGVQKPLIASPTFANAQQLALEKGGQAIPWEKWQDHLVKTDVLVTAASTLEPLLDLKKLKTVQEKRHEKPMLIIDISVPRNVAEDVENLNGVYRYDLDSLENIINTHSQKRNDQIEKSREILSNHVTHLIMRLERSDLNAFYQDLNARMAKLQQDEFDQIQHLIPEEFHDLVKKSLFRFGNKLLHPIRSQAPDVFKNSEPLRQLVFGKKEK